MVPEEAQMSVLLPTTVTKVSAALCACHVITALRSLNVDLAAWAFLSVPLATFDDTGPVAQQFVSFPVVPTLQAFMPGRVAFKTPDKLALGALNLILMFTLGGRLLAATPQGRKQAALRTRFCAGVQLAQFQKVLVFCKFLTGQV